VPTYQYACTDCGEPLEAVQSFSDPALTVCPNCEGRLRKVFNSVGIVFKGSGFYRNDSRAGNGSTEKSGESSSSETKSDTKKPETTSTTPAPTPAAASTTSSTSSNGSSSSAAKAGTAS